MLLNLAEGALRELLYADDLFMCPSFALLIRTKTSAYSNSLSSPSWENQGTGGITKDGMSESKVDPCGFYSLRIMTNSVLCPQCGKWIHGRCAGVKRVTPVFKK